MRPALSYIRSAQLVSGVMGGDARGRRPLAKKLRLSPFPAGEGGRGDGAMRFAICHGINQTHQGQAPER